MVLSVEIKHFFTTINVSLSDLWLESCINWYHEQNPGVQYTLEELQNKVYEQWLLLDLTDAQAACLPSNLSQQKKMVLNGIYCLQMQHVVDIAKPKHLQLQKIRSSNTLTSFEQFKEKEFTDSKRVLQLTLTDGVQEVDAIEYTPISVLNVNLLPGVKIRITGPVTVRRGKIFLEERNVKILGGEVEEILVTNATENVMARAIGVAENPNPRRIEEVLENGAHEIQDERNQDRVPNQPVRRVQRNLETTSNTTRPPEINRIDAEIDMLMEAERDMQPQTANFFEDDIDFSSVDLDNIEKTLLQQTKSQTAIPQVNLLDGLDSDDDVFREIDIDAHLNAVENELRNKTMTLKDLRNATGVFKVRAKFVSIVEKLTANEGKWTIKILLSDNNDQIAVNLHTDVVTKFLGYDHSALMKLKNGANQKGTDSIFKALANFKSKLLKLDCMMEIAVEDGTIPMVVACLD